MGTKQIKVVRLIARLNVGGPAKHVAWLTAHLDPERYQTILAAGRVEENEAEMDYFVADAGVVPVYLDAVRRSIGPGDLPAFFNVLRLLWQERPDILHTHASKAGFLGRSAARLLNCIRWLTGRRRIKVVHTFHGHTFHSYHGKFFNWLILTIERLLARFATDIIIVISPRQQEEIHEIFGIGRRDQFRLVPLGLDLTAYDALERNRGRFKKLFNLSPQTTVVGIVGRLTGVKNHLRFLALCDHLVKHAVEVLERRRVRFAIIGDGELRDMLTERARKLGLLPFVLFTGNMENQLDYLPDLTIFTLTSDNEGTPLTIIEAMACGVPVIATAVGGVPDLLGEGERGILISKEDVPGFAGALAHLLDCPEHQEELADKGRAFVRQAYSLQRLLSDIDALYRELVSGS